MRFLTLCSGIGAPEIAWRDIPGWSCVGQAEIEPAACAVLKHHFPGVPNLGDVEKITEADIAALGQIGLMIFGFPCQDISCAGKRKGLKDDETGEFTRSGLFFEAMRLVRIARRRSGLRWLVVENVEGLFSSNAGRDFGTVVGEILGTEFDVPRDGWENCGAAASEAGLVEWSLLDAQFFGLAQRRERVFLVADFGNWADRAPVLLERESLLGNSPPRRKTGQDVAGTIASGLGRRSAEEAERGTLIPDVADPILVKEGETYTHEGVNFRTRNLMAFGGNNTNGPIDVATACRAKGGTGHGDFESETFVSEPIPILEAGARTGRDGYEGRDGIGVGEPGDPMFTLQSSKQHGVAEPIPFDTTQITHPENRSRPSPGDPAPTLAKDGHAPSIAFTCKDYGQDMQQDISPTLRAMNQVDGNANAGGQVAVAFQERGRKGGPNVEFQEDLAYALTAPKGGGRHQEMNIAHGDAVAFKPSHYTRGKDEAPSEVYPPLSADADKGDQEALIFESRFARNGRGAPEEICPPLKAQSGQTGKGDAAPLLAQAWAVRRLLPVECERLQGFGDAFTLVPYRSGMMKDGPRYARLGNAMPVPVVKWIGLQIDVAHKASSAYKESADVPVRANRA